MSALVCEHVMSLRGEVLSFYKQVIRLSKNWKALNPSKTSIEQQYIRNEAKRIFSDNKNLTNEEEIKKLLEEGFKRVEVAKHYRIPYPRPVYYSTGTYLRKQK